MAAGALWEGFLRKSCVCVCRGEAKQNKEAEGLSKGVAMGPTLVRVCSLNTSAQCLTAP